MVKDLLEFFRLTFFKLFLAILAIFLVPTFFKVCYEGGGCVYKFTLFAGFILWQQKVQGLLTFPMMFLLFFNAYLISCLVVFFYKKAVNRKEKEIF
ncbi:hypothetical protein HY643_00945 [Candidatus Woesearchaeota archaeon]|nr:hypothetical protein [Candidatus Woesearchaeota archaeon]